MFTDHLVRCRLKSHNFWNHLFWLFSDEALTASEWKMFVKEHETTIILRDFANFILFMLMYLVKYFSKQAVDLRDYLLLSSPTSALKYIAESTKTGVPKLCSHEDVLKQDEESFDYDRKPEAEISFFALSVKRQTHSNRILLEAM